MTRPRARTAQLAEALRDHAPTPANPRGGRQAPTRATTTKKKNPDYKAVLVYVRRDTYAAFRAALFPTGQEVSEFVEQAFRDYADRQRPRRA